VRRVEVNGHAGAVVLDGAGKLGVEALDIARQEFRSVVGIVNPDKRQHLGPLLAKVFVEPVGAENPITGR